MTKVRHFVFPEQNIRQDKDQVVSKVSVIIIKVYFIFRGKISF